MLGKDKKDHSSKSRFAPQFQQAWSKAALAGTVGQSEDGRDQPFANIKKTLTAIAGILP